MADFSSIDMKRYVGFTSAEATLLHAIAPAVRSKLPEVTRRFYAILGQDPGARALLNAEPGRIDLLTDTLNQWLRELFEGQYDQDYFDQRARIGRAHVRVELPQHYMSIAMTIIRQSLTQLVRESGSQDVDATLDALNKLLDLELATMLETYREDLSAKIRMAEREHMQARLDEAHHMASIGQLAAALAHEIKNPLAGISGAIQVILQSTPRDHPHREVLHEIMAQIDRLDAAVRDALIYSRPKPPRRRPHPIGTVLHRVLSFLGEEPAIRDVRLQCEGLDTDIVAEVDEAQLQQVISNLLINAAHATPRGGVVHLGLTDVANKVRIEVSDDGHGMPPEVRVHAFEPFYTTKAKGTGLGLPICKHIVMAHGGTISIDSRQGEGTTVLVELPKSGSGTDDDATDFVEAVV